MHSSFLLSMVFWTIFSVSSSTDVQIHSAFKLLEPKLIETRSLLRSATYSKKAQRRTRIRIGLNNLKQLIYDFPNTHVFLFRSPRFLEVPDVAVDDNPRRSRPFSAIIISARWIMYRSLFKSCMATLPSWPSADFVGSYRSWVTASRR